MACSLIPTRFSADDAVDASFDPRIVADYELGRLSPLEIAGHDVNCAPFNLLADQQRFNNHYLVIRHPKSEANSILVDGQDVGGILAGSWNGASYEVEGEPHVLDARMELGLSELGWEQLEDSLDGISELSLYFPHAIVFSPDTRRNIEVAERTRERLGILAETKILPDLRVRHYGQFEGTSLKNAHLVYEHDRGDPFRRLLGAEPLACLVTRLTSAIASIEKRYSNRLIIIAGNSDTLRVLEALTIDGFDVRNHNDLPTLGNAQFAEMQIGDPWRRF